MRKEVCMSEVGTPPRSFNFSINYKRKHSADQLRNFLFKSGLCSARSFCWPLSQVSLSDFLITRQKDFFLWLIKTSALAYMWWNKAGDLRCKCIWSPLRFLPLPHRPFLVPWLPHTSSCHCYLSFIACFLSSSTTSLLLSPQAALPQRNLRWLPLAALQQSSKYRIFHMVFTSPSHVCSGFDSKIPLWLLVNVCLPYQTICSTDTKAGFFSAVFGTEFSTWSAQDQNLEMSLQ